jgi:ArsR family transcriptional regulator
MNSYKCCDSNKLEFKNIRSLSTLLKLIAEESRLKILCILGSGKHCVCEIMGNIDLSQSLVSHHLLDLKEAGLVNKEKKGRRVYYQLTNYGKKLMNIVQNIEIKKEVSQ